MNEQPETKDLAEQCLNHVLRELPLRRAPATLESRVLKELKRGADLPWWRRGFGSWPFSVRAAFVAGCGAIIGSTLLEGSWAIAGVRVLNEAVIQSMSWMHPAVAAVTSAGQFAALLERVIPSTWLYGVIVAGALLYAALFGLGAAAYRTLYLQPSIAGDRR
ncbi:MAG TPA: hypothetical protein VNR70_06525 [Steroidobacteraceae bacterium]|jgi:hypothetical protein|nr:hypothetical protein [Steroidobacteraceae bacterium]